MELAPGSLIDRYTVVGPLGEGGMSVVYKVRHNQLGSLHALKVLTLSTPGLRQRLLLEGQVQASLRHPNIVPVTDVIDVNGAPGLVMEFVEGPDLDAMLRAHPLSFDQIDALARDIIGAVVAAHAKGLIHRDLKPANILLMVVDDRLIPKITDFGLAKVLSGPSGERAHTRTGAMMGTPFYMAPEQVRDAKNVGPAADVFSLGAILYEMVTRERAFVGEDLFEVFSAVAQGIYVPVRERVPDIPARMEAAIGAALRVDLAERCTDCRELLALWNGEAGTGRPTSPWSGELLRSASGLASSPPVSKPTMSTFDEARSAPGADAAAPSRPPSPSRSGVTVPPRGALALGVLVGGGGAALLGLLALAVLLVGGWAVWRFGGSGSAPEPVPVGVDAAPIAVPPEPEPIAEVSDGAPSETEGPVPVPAPVPAPAPAPSGTAPPAPLPVAPPVETPVAAPEPARGALPEDLDPDRARPNTREEALLGPYRSKPEATGLIVRVLKTDPSPDVRDIAAGVLRARMRDGTDAAGAEAGIAWCAKSGGSDKLRAQCLKTLGELGGRGAGAVIGTYRSDGVSAVRDAASGSCRKWTARWPGEPGCSD